MKLFPAQYFQKFATTVKRVRTFFYQTLNSIYNMKFNKQNINKKWGKEKKWLHQISQKKRQKKPSLNLYIFFFYF